MPNDPYCWSFIWRGSSYFSLFKPCALGTVLKVVAFRGWQRPKSSLVKHFFLAAWGEAWMLTILLLCVYRSSPWAPVFSRRLCVETINSTSLFMAVIDSNLFQCIRLLFWMLIALDPAFMRARMVHSMPPLLNSSHQLHSRLKRSFNGSLYLSTLSFSPVSTRWMRSFKAGLSD